MISFAYGGFFAGCSSTSLFLLYFTIFFFKSQAFFCINSRKSIVEKGQILELFLISIKALRFAIKYQIARRGNGLDIAKNGRSASLFGLNLVAQRPQTPIIYGKTFYNGGMGG